MAIATQFVLACLAAGLLLPSVAHASEACAPAEEGLVFGEVIRVEGSDGAYRLLCRDGQLTAVPVDKSDAPSESAVDLGGPPVSIEGTEPSSPAQASDIAGTIGAIAPAPENDVGLHAAGVAGQVPAATFTQSAAEARTQPSPLPPVSERGDETASKPGISADAAAPGDIKPGATKSDARISVEESAPRPETELSPEMVRVPAPIVTAARQVLPGIAFKNVILSRDGSSTIYGLAGVDQGGRSVSVDVDQAGAVLKVDRQIGKNEVPEMISLLRDVVLPDAEIGKGMMSVRPNFQTFFVFAGKTAADEDFTIEIRSDGRSLAFIDAR